jgi:hypothetical protein
MSKRSGGKQPTAARQTEVGIDVSKCWLDVSAQHAAQVYGVPPVGHRQLVKWLRQFRGAVRNSRARGHRLLQPRWHAGVAGRAARCDGSHSPRRAGFRSHLQRTTTTRSRPPRCASSPPACRLCPGSRRPRGSASCGRWPDTWRRWQASGRRKRTACMHCGPPRTHPRWRSATSRGIFAPSAGASPHCRARPRPSSARTPRSGVPTSNCGRSRTWDRPECRAIGWLRWKSLGRRSQRGRITRERMARLQRFNLPRVRICHPYPSFQQLVRT